MTNLLPDNDRVTLTLAETGPEAGVAHLRLSRPDKMNALDNAMIDALLSVGPALEAEKGVRCLVVSGEGRSFCAGLDLSTIGGGLDKLPQLAPRTHGDANAFQQLAMQFRRLPVPVIAAIHGVCFGGGLQIAAGADIRLIAPDARLCVMEMKWGIVPDMGHYALWRDLVRDDVLREVTYTHREFSGEDAVRLGFATRCAADPLSAAQTLASEIAGKNPQGIRAAKALANLASDADTPTILLAESTLQQPLLGSPNQVEAVMSQMEGRQGRFSEA